MAQGFFLRFVFIFNVLHLNYFSFLDMLVLGILILDEKNVFLSHRCYFDTCGNRQYQVSVSLNPLPHAVGRVNLKDISQGSFFLSFLGFEDPT